MTKLLQSYWKFHNPELSKEESREEERQEHRVRWRAREAGRQAATVAAAGWGEAGQREPERGSRAEDGEKEGGGAGDSEKERAAPAQKLNPAGRDMASASTRALAALQWALLSQLLW